MIDASWKLGERVRDRRDGLVYEITWIYYGEATLERVGGPGTRTVRVGSPEAQHYENAAEGVQS